MVFPFHQGRFQGEDGSTYLPIYFLFPFHQGRFQGPWAIRADRAKRLFPFHQGRFQGAAPPITIRSGSRVSIPPRKVSRRDAVHRRVRDKPAFPFHQGRFQGPTSIQSFPNQQKCPFHQGRCQGSIGTASLWSTSSFHSTKEGFKGGKGFQALFATLVSIPPRKVSRLVGGIGFAAGRKFPFHQGRFQGTIGLFRFWS